MGIRDDRKDERFSFSEDIIIDDQVFTNAVDVSVGGLLIRTNQPFEVDSFVTLTIPSFGLTIKASIKHSRPGFATGLKFVYETAEDWTHVSDMIDQLRERQEAEGEILKHSVLIVDDSESYRQAMGERLRLEGLSVAEAADGMAAIRQMNSYPTDAVLLDLQMGRIDGLKLIGLIREAPDHKDTPLIVLSAKDDKPTIDRVLRAGATAFIGKNEATPDLVVDTLRKALADKSAGPRG